MASQAELRYFIEVANSLNLSRASERLGISQPSLSVAIKRLEGSIGTELLIRQKRGVALTQAGKQLLAHAKQLLQYWDEVRSQALASHHEIQGNFILGCHPSLGLSYLSGFLPELLLTYPKLELQLKYDISRKITESVINLSIDVGLVVNPVKHPDLIIHKLKDDEVTFWSSSKIKNKHQDIYSGDAMIICDIELTQTQWLLKNLQKKHIKYTRLLTGSNLEMIAKLIVNHCGIGILPGSVASSLYPQLIKPIAKMPVYHDEVCLIYRHENRNIKAIQIIINAIKTYFKKI
ncbi:MAG: transcriptional regulator (LysR family) [uncultured bacterium]|nr:MAG: transcriptional regulator (LysR family) [uncultured bacterium]